jgi:hypothetical protein
MNTKQKSVINSWLHSMLGSDDLVARWWNSPNRAFNGRTPQELYDRDLIGKQTVTSYVFEYLQK